MCDHIGCDPFTESDSTSNPRDVNQYHIYYVHQDGSVKRHPDVPFPDPQATSGVGEAIIGNHVVDCGTVKPDGKVEKVEGAESEGQKNDENSAKSDEAFCGDGRLTLIQLPLVLKPVTKTDQAGPSTELLQDILPHTMPTFFKEKLKNICEYCECKQEVLWNNLLRDEQHFDACFRYVNKDPTRKCFLKLYTLRVPFLSDLTISFSMVHHIRAEGDVFVPAKRDISVPTDKKAGDNKEHMFAFIYGLDGSEIWKLLTGLVKRWQDIVGDHADPSTGITPRLFVAALLSHYGSIISKRIRDAYVNVNICDSDLQTAMDILEEELPEPCHDQTIQIRKINKSLIDMNVKLTGTRSTMHYLAASADVLVNNITPFEMYVKTRLAEWPNSKKLIKALRKLDSYREKIRDHDKLVMVRKDMLQHKTDIEALQQHININVGMVSNVIAARDRSIQQSIMANTGRDGAKMKFIAILTAIFLPGTFVAIFLTTPMFNFVEDTKPLLTKRGIPLAIYWGVTCLGFILILILLYLLHNPIIVCNLIDHLIPLKSIQNSAFYNDCKQRSSKLTAKKYNEGGAATQRQKPIDSNKDHGAEKQKKKALFNNGSPEQQFHPANGVNGKSTSTDGNSQAGSKSSPGWLRRGRVALCCDSHV